MASDHFGQRVPVHHCQGAYRLPDGLPDGVEVTLVGFDIGYWTVSYNDKLYRVAMACVGDSGMLPLPNKFDRARREWLARQRKSH